VGPINPAGHVALAAIRKPATQLLIDSFKLPVPLASWHLPPTNYLLPTPTTYHKRAEQPVSKIAHTARGQLHQLEWE